MGQILGLGITHYPPLCYKGNMTGRITVLGRTKQLTSLSASSSLPTFAKSPTRQLKRVA